MTAQVRMPASAPERQAALGAGAATDQWVSLGPATVTRGRAARLPRVAGRVRALSVSPDGQRVYAGTALGGVWYSDDGGDHWRTLDFYTSTLDGSNALQHTDALTVGAIAVVWGTAATDVVYVGAGEHPALGSDAGTATLQAAGIRVATGPAAAVLPAPIAAGANVGPAQVDPWRVESAELTGLAVNQFAVDLAAAGVVWAATSQGLYRRKPPAAGVPVAWNKVVTPFGDVEMSAVVAVAGAVGGEAQRLYVATATGRLAFSTDGNAWTEIALTPFPDTVVPATVKITRMRLAVAHGPVNPVVYALADGPRLWRIDAAAATQVSGAPSELSAADADGLDPFGLAIAAHPTNDAAHQDMIVLGGQALAVPGAPRQAALYIYKVQRSGAKFEILPAAPVGGVAAEWVGSGVPPGVHALAWVTVGANTHLWLGGDAGVFRWKSTAPRPTFEERNTGLAAVEVTSLAQAGDDAVLFAGTRSNGVLRRRGPSAWSVAPVKWQDTDATGRAIERDLRRVGGVAVDPADARRVYVQGEGALWAQSEDGGDTFTKLAFRTTLSAGDTTATAAEKKREHTASAPAGRMALLNVPDDPRGTLKVLGTDRVWYTDDGLLLAAKVPGSVASGWVTLPTATDPFGAAAPATRQDTLDGAVLSCLWAGPDRLYALTAKSIYLFDRNPAGGWKAFEKLYDSAAVTVSTKRKNAQAMIPPDLPLVSLAVRNATTGKGTLYAGTAGPGDKSHLWYYDGAGKWLTTGFLRDTPIYAIAVDPAADAVVYVATRAGVFKGTGTFPTGAAPTWVWQQYSRGLPEAPCVDLALYAPVTGPKRLRAALAGRGVWELVLDGVARGPEVYLCAHTFDTRRADVAAGGARNPVSRTRAQERLDASPDIRVRRQPGAPASTPVATRAFSAVGYDRFLIDATSDPYDIWLMQSALRARGEDVDPDATWSADSAAKRANQAALLPAPPAPPPPPPSLAQRTWTAFMANNALGVDRDMDAADLATYVRDEPDRWPKGMRTSCASAPLARVHVAVHSRFWRPIKENPADPASPVYVALLKAPFGMPATATAPARSARETLADVPDLPANWANAVSAGAALPAGAWAYADPANPRQKLASLLDVNNPGVVRFDVDLAGASWDRPGWLLLAVVMAPGDPFATNETNVATLVRTNHHVAARSVRNANVLGEPLERYGGMDVGSYPGTVQMDPAWVKSNMYFTGMYLESPRPVIGDNVTGDTHATHRDIRRIRIGGAAKDVRQAAIGWAVGMPINGPDIPAGATIASIGADGLSLTISADAANYHRAVAISVPGAATPNATADICRRNVITEVSLDVRDLGWAVGKRVGADGIPLGTTITQILPGGGNTWLEISSMATATADHIQLFTTFGDITAASANVANLTENVFDAGWRTGMSIDGAGILPGTTIQAIAANGLSLTLSAPADAAPATTKARVPLKVGELVISPKPVSGHARWNGLVTRADEQWMRGWLELHDAWGIAPIYWGQQAIDNADGPTDLGTRTAARVSPPDMALENARDAVSKAVRANIPFGAAVYLDWEKSLPLPPAGLAYCSRFFRCMREFGYRSGVYAQVGPTPALADATPGLLIWNVRALAGTTKQQPGDITFHDGQYVLRTPPLVASPGILFQQWRFDSGFPFAGLAGPSPLPGFPKIDLDAGIIADPAYPERQFLPGAMPGGRLGVIAYDATRALVFGVRQGQPKIAIRTVAGPSAKYEQAFDADWPFWWNPFSAPVALQIAPPGTPPPADAPPTDLLLAVGAPKIAGTAQAEGPWRITAVRRRRATTAAPQVREKWACEIVPAAGAAVDPLPGVIAVTRGDRSVDVFGVDDASGELVVSRCDPAAATNKNAWSPLAPLSTPSGEIRRTNRPAVVSRDKGIADLFWVKPFAGAGVDVAGATRVAPIAITTTAPHNLATGDPVLVSGVGGNIAANGVFTITVTGASTFTLDDTRGSGAYAGGGHVTPLDGRVYESSSALATPTQWSAANRIGAANVRTHPFSNLVAVSTSTGRIDVFFVGRADGTTDWLLQDAFWTTAGGWNAANSLSTVPVVAPNVKIDPLVPIAALSRSATSIDVFVVGINGSLYYTTLNTGAGTWSAFQAIGGAHVACIEGATRVGADGGVVVVSDRVGGVYSSRWAAGAYGALTATTLDP